MALKPVDIYNKEFSKSIRGYNPDQVDEFLDEVIKDYEQLFVEKKNLESQIEKLETKIAQYASIEDTLNKSIVLAQDTAQRVKEDSEKTAALLIKEAEKEASKIVNRALDKGRQIELEIEKLKNQSQIVRNRFKMLLEAQLTMLENDDFSDYSKSAKIVG